jgi:hypothetical protein
MSKAPEICSYCDGLGNSRANGPCGFCTNGKPLDTQEDWNQSWGKLKRFMEKLNSTKGDQEKIQMLLHNEDYCEQCSGMLIWDAGERMYYCPNTWYHG